MAIEDYLNVAEPTDQVIETDAVIVGAGPVGLFQVFELGLLEIKAHVVDSLKNVGGQCMELYPTKPIYDIPAVPVYSSYELTENLLKQIHPFNPTFHLGQEVTVVKKREDGLFDVETDKGTKFLCKVVIIAAGVKHKELKTKHDRTDLVGKGVYTTACVTPSFSPARTS